MNALNGQKLLSEEFSFHVLPAATLDRGDLVPAVTLRRVRMDEASCAWDDIELCIACAPSRSADAFITDYNDTGVSLDDIDDESGKRTRKRITTTAAALLARQQRTFAFSLLICGSHARFIRWDRAGAIVTRHFDYHRHPRLLAEFFWRFGQLSAALRGHDPTAHLVGAAERTRFRLAISSYAESLADRQIPKLQDACDPTYPCYRITVTGTDGTSRDYLLQRPISSPSSPVGRSTRGYFALDLTSNEIVFLKDYWRPTDSARPPEADVYDALRQSSIPHLPHVRVAGDVPDREDRGQCTLTDRWRHTPGICSGSSVKLYRHHRVVQDVAFSLETIRSSRELVQAIRNTIECACSLTAWKCNVLTIGSGIRGASSSQWLHRDISAGNVMLREDGQGILNDWDHCIQLDPDNPGASRRTVSFKFLN